MEALRYQWSEEIFRELKKRPDIKWEIFGPYTSLCEGVHTLSLNKIFISSRNLADAELVEAKTQLITQSAETCNMHVVEQYGYATSV